MSERILKKGSHEYKINGDMLIDKIMFPNGIRKPIGVGSLNSFDSSFENEKIIVRYDACSNVCAKMGDIAEAYKILDKKLQQKKEKNLDSICDAVFETVSEYFGGFQNINQRMTFYKDEDNIQTEADYGTISSMKGKESAMCVERAALSQNLFQHLGLHSLFKSTRILNCGKPDAHAFNLIEFEGKYYIFDATIPTLKGNNLSAIICEIDKDTFDLISMPMFDGISVEVSHFNPFRDKNVTIVYDSGREKKVVIENGSSPSNE